MSGVELEVRDYQQNHHQYPAKAAAMVCDRGSQTKTLPA